MENKGKKSYFRHIKKTLPQGECFDNEGGFVQNYLKRVWREYKNA